MILQNHDFTRQSLKSNLQIIHSCVMNNCGNIFTDDYISVSPKELGISERHYQNIQKELDAANVEHVLFEGIRPNPTDINVMVCC